MIPDDDVLNWIISSAGNCVKYVVDETINASVLHKAIISISSKRPLLEIARQKFIENRMDDTQLKILQRKNEFLEGKSKELIASNFHSINSHGLIGLWCTLETAVEDTVVLILIKDPAAIDTLITAEYKIKPKFIPNMPEYDARNLYSSLEKQVRQNLTVGEAYCKLLSVFGINIILYTSEVETLEEINSVRNCILHRGGIIDDKAAQSSSRLRRFYNKKINITNELYMEYYDAIGGFAQKLLNATLKSKYIKKSNL